MNPYNLDGTPLRLTQFENEDDLDDEALAASLDEVKAGPELGAWLLRLAKAGRSIDGEIRGLTGWKQEIEARIEVRRRRLDALRAYLRITMDASGLTHLRDGQINAWTQPASQPAVVVEDLGAIPPTYRRIDFNGSEAGIPEDVLSYLLEHVESGETHIEAAKAKILDAVKDTGEAVPGVSIERRRFVTWR